MTLIALLIFSQEHSSLYVNPFGTSIRHDSCERDSYKVLVHVSPVIVLVEPPRYGVT